MIIKLNVNSNGNIIQGEKMKICKNVQNEEKNTEKSEKSETQNIPICLKNQKKKRNKKKWITIKYAKWKNKAR